MGETNDADNGTGLIGDTHRIIRQRHVYILQVKTHSLSQRVAAVKALEVAVAQLNTRVRPSKISITSILFK